MTYYSKILVVALFMMFIGVSSIQAGEKGSMSQKGILKHDVHNIARNNGMVGGTEFQLSKKLQIRWALGNKSGCPSSCGNISASYGALAVNSVPPNPQFYFCRARENTTDAYRPGWNTTDPRWKHECHYAKGGEKHTDTYQCLCYIID